MYTNIFQKTGNLSFLNNPLLNNNININNGKSINNNLLTNKSILAKDINPFNNQLKIKVINLPNNFSNINRSNSAINIKPKKNQLYSSGTLILSKNSKKENKVKKNGKEICNIDINKDLEEIKKEVNHNISVNNINTNNLLNNDTEKLNNGYIHNINSNNSLGSNIWDKRVSNIKYSNPEEKNFVNPMVRFVNFITDMFSSKTDKNYSKEILNQNENNLSLIPENIHLQNNLNPKIISPIQSNDEINNNQSNGLYLENKSSKTLIKSNSYTNINQNTSLNKLVNQSSINVKKNLNNSVNKTSNINISDKKSQILEKEKDLKSKKSESKASDISKNNFPFQPINIIVNNKNNRNSYRNSNNLLNGNLQNLIQPKNIIYQKQYKGFRFCHELTKPGKELDGNTKVDQDAPLMKLNIGGVIGFNMFGVLDGHGPHGHFVSQFCKEYFIKNITLYTDLLKLKKGISTCEEIYNELKINNFYIIMELFNYVDKEISSQNIFEYNTSGTTCNLVFQFNKHLICFNVGDSRSIIIYDEGNNRNQGIFPLSVDHKPNLPGEYERIKLSGGDVDYLKDTYGNNLGPPRVYKVGCQYPSLAMSRSLGDFQAKEVGVISIPQIIEYDINFTTKYLVICSDGVWEFISNDQVRNIGNKFYATNDIVGFCSELISISTKIWEQNDIIRDDITVVSVFF